LITIRMKNFHQAAISLFNLRLTGMITNFEGIVVVKIGHESNRLLIGTSCGFRF
jgi:hypothetical protein